MRVLRPSSGSQRTSRPHLPVLPVSCFKRFEDRSSLPHSVLTRSVMPCNPDVLRQVPLFALLDEEEIAVLAEQVGIKTFATRQRIYKAGDPGGRAYVMISGSVRVTTLDEDHQEVVIQEPATGEFFGFASMFEHTPHQTEANALEQSVCLEIDRDHIAVLVHRKPDAGMDM